MFLRNDHDKTHLRFSIKTRITLDMNFQWLCLRRVGMLKQGRFDVE